MWSWCHDNTKYSMITTGLVNSCLRPLLPHCWCRPCMTLLNFDWSDGFSGAAERSEDHWISNLVRKCRTLGRNPVWLFLLLLLLLQVSFAWKWRINLAYIFFHGLPCFTWGGHQCQPLLYCHQQAPSEGENKKHRIRRCHSEDYGLWSTIPVKHLKISEWFEPKKYDRSGFFHDI